MIYDITTPDNAYKWILNFYDISEDELIQSYVIKYKSNNDEFIESQIYKVNKWNIDNMEVAVIHVTSNNDKCNEIKDKGILNLQKALTEDTELNRFLNNYEIKFDIKKKVLVIGSKEYNINYNYYKDKALNFQKMNTEEKALKGVARKIYFDFQVNGFLFSQDVSKYGTEIHKRPEILYDIDKLLKNNERLSKNWAKTHQGYKIKFKSKLSDIQHFTFYYSMEEFEEDKTNKYINLKKKLVSFALDIAFSKKSSDIYVYMNKEISILNEKIKDCCLI